jgi:hypothetical protein
MKPGKINTLTTSQDAPGYIWHHTKHTHPASNGSVTVSVVLPKTTHVDGFPVDYAVSVTPDQPCAVSVANKTRYGFDVTLTSLDDGLIRSGNLMLLVVG